MLSNEFTKIGEKMGDKLFFFYMCRKINDFSFKL